MQANTFAALARIVLTLGILAVQPVFAQPAVEETAAPAKATPVADDPKLEARIMALSHTLRCLVCQNQSIAESNAPLAVDLREQVREQFVAGKSEQEIIDYLTARYGDFVLYLPPFKPSTWVLWLAPALLFIAGAIGLGIRLRRRAHEKTTALSGAERERARTLLESSPSSEQGS